MHTLSYTLLMSSKVQTFKTRKVKHIMSKVAETATVADPNVISKEYTKFDLDSMKEITETVNVTFVPASNSKEAFDRIGNDETVLVEALNDYLREKALRDAKKAFKAGGASKATVYAFIKPMREFAEFKKLEGDRKAQTEAILAKVRTIDFLLDNLKALAAAESDTAPDAPAE